MEIVHKLKLLGKKMKSHDRESGPSRHSFGESFFENLAPIFSRDLREKNIVESMWALDIILICRFCLFFFFIALYFLSDSDGG